MSAVGRPLLFGLQCQGALQWAAMPPFGEEPAEPEAEPFADEQDERAAWEPPKAAAGSAKRRRVGAASALCEPEEQDVRVYCGAEPEEHFDGYGESSDSSQTDSDRRGIAELQAAPFRIVSLGWEAMHKVRGASFWGQQASVPKQRAKRPYDNTQRKAAAAAAAARKPKTRTYRENGANPERIAALLKRAQCECRSDGSTNCYKQFSVKELQAFLGAYWTWPKWEQQGVVTSLVGYETGARLLSCSAALLLLRCSVAQ